MDVKLESIRLRQQIGRGLLLVTVITDEHGFRSQRHEGEQRRLILLLGDAVRILRFHFTQDDRMPSVVPLFRGDVVLAGPASQPQFADQIEFDASVAFRLRVYQ